MIKKKRKTKEITKKGMNMAWKKTVKMMLGDMCAKKKAAAPSAPAAAPSAGSQAIGSQPSSSSIGGALSCGDVARQRAALAAMSEKSKQDKIAWQRAEAKNGLAPPVTPLRVPGIRLSTKKSEEQETKGTSALSRRRSEADAKKQGAKASAPSQKIHPKKTSKHTGSQPAVVAKPRARLAASGQVKRALRATLVKWRPTPPALKKRRLDSRAELNSAMQAWAQQWGSAA